MEAALMPDERTDLVSTNRLGHGWAYLKLTNQQAIFRARHPIGAAADLKRLKRCAELNN